MKMKHIDMQLIVSVFGGFLTCFFGGLDELLLALIIFIVMDYLSGVACAIYRKKLSSAIGAKGILKKVLIFLVIGLSNVIDTLILGNQLLRDVIIFFYLSNEGISILENCTQMGLPVPKKLKEVLNQLKKEDSGVK